METLKSLVLLHTKLVLGYNSNLVIEESMRFEIIKSNKIPSKKRPEIMQSVKVGFSNNSDK